MSSPRDRLAEILIRDQIISLENLDKALAEQKKSGGELTRILLKLHMINEEQMVALLATVLQLPILDLARLKLTENLIKLIPEDIANKYQVLPVSKMGNHLTIAMADPMDVIAIDNVKEVTGLSVSPILSRGKDIARAIQKYYSANSAQTMQEIIKDIKDSEELELVKEDEKTPDKKEVENLTQDAPVIKLTNAIIAQAVAAKASDVFIEPLEQALRIRYRVDGMLREIDRMSKVLHFPIISRIKVISNLDISEHRLPQDGRFRTVVGSGQDVDFRVNVLPTAMGEKIVFRILDKNLEMLDVEKLGFEPDSLKRLKESCQRPHGMILACGPTGSGKTTTLYSILKHIDSPGKNIITVEDPVEYQVKGYSQVNIRPEVGLTFTSALRSILRQDPDVIMIGEVRDSETLNIAVKAALTGHLVVSSLHTTTAAGSVTRMINMGIEPFLICSSVIAIVAQRLLRRTCAHCKEKVTISKTLYEKLYIGRIVPEKGLEFVRGKGCAQCFQTGYRGRVGITETMVLTPRVKELVLARASEADVKKISRKEGMLTMREDGIIKAARDLTTLEEVVRVTAPDEAL